MHTTMSVHRYAIGLMVGAAAVTCSMAPAWSQQPVHLNFWDMIWGPPEYIDAAKGLVDEFNKKLSRDLS